MKNFAAFLGLFILVFLSCTEQDNERPGSLVLTGVSGSKGSEIICVNIDSGAVVNTTAIDCYVFGSTVYDPATGGYGYVSCDSTFYLINPESGEIIKSIKLPGYISQTVIDTDDNLLIGRYTTTTYENDPDTIKIKSAKTGPPVYTNHIIRINLSTGAIVSDNKTDLGDGVYLSTYYYDQKGKNYILYRADNYLITINPSTGEIIKEQYVGKSLTNSVYNPISNSLISLNYSTSDQRNYLLEIDPETGSEISNNIVEPENGYCSNISGYDKDNNWYITVNSDYEVICYDISTGEIKKTYKLENPMSDIKFWRR